VLSAIPAPVPVDARRADSAFGGSFPSLERSMTDCVCSIDLGTSSIKGGVFDLDGHALFRARAPAPPLSDWNGFITFAPDAYLDQAFSVLRELMGQVAASGQSHRVLGVAAACQRATVVGLDARGNPRTPFLCWHDTSTAEAIASFIETYPLEHYRAITGLPPSFMLSLSRILALRIRVPAEAAEIHRFALLQDLFLLRLGAGGVFCDPSNGAAMGLYDLNAGDWNNELLGFANLTPDHLPELVPAGTAVGYVSTDAARRSNLPAGAALFVGAGDQACSTLAAGAYGPDRISACLGTAGVFNQTVTEPDTRAEDPWYCLPHAVPGFFVREGIVPSVGSSFEWIVRTTGIGDVRALDAEARRSPLGANGLRFLPFLSGIGTPEYAASMAGSFQEIRASHTRADLVRAVIEGVALEIRRVLGVLDPTQASGIVISGNACRSQMFTETLAELSHGRLLAPDDHDLSLRGAALIAATGLGRFASLAEACAHAGGRLTTVRAAERDERTEGLFTDYQSRVAGALTGSVVAPALVENLGFPRSTRRKVDEMIRKSLKLGRVAFYCYRLDGTITYMDRAALRIIDCEDRYPDPSALVGVNLRDLIEYVQPEGQLRQAILASGEAVRYEYHFRTLTGRDRWTLHDSFLDTDPETEEPIIYAMVLDITEKKLAALEIEQSRTRLRELAQRLLAAREQERAQLAGELHDGIAQNLFALRMYLTSLARPVLKSEDLSKGVSLIDAELDRTLSSVVSLIETLRQSVFRELGLVTAMDQELREIAANTPFHVSLRVDGDREIFSHTPLENGLFRIFRAATANSVGHSGGSRIDAMLTVTPDTIEMVVADDGVGLPRHATTRPQGLELLAIEEGALSLNGEARFEANTPHGTIIRVRVPRPGSGSDQRK
jgi:xylulokinase